MNRRNLTLAVVGAVMLALAIALVVRVASRPPADRLIVAGDVRVNSRTVAAPAITTPTPDFSVGIPTPATTPGGGSSAQGGSAKRSASTQPARTGLPTVSGKLTSVDVRVGDTVKAGQIVAQMDTKLLDLGVAQAKANAARSKAKVAVIGKQLDTLNSALDKLPSARATAFATIDAAIAKATAPLFSQHAAAVRARPKLAAGIASIKGALAQMPPNAPQRPALQKQLAQLKKTLAGIDAFLRQWPTIQRMLAQQTAAAKAKVNSAIDKAQNQLTDFKSQATNGRKLLKISADASHVGIDLAEFNREQATILAPVSGIVTFAVPSGTVAMVGSPIVRIQPDEPAMVDTYLTPEQLPRVRVGSSADITYDSAPGKVLHGKVAVIGTTAAFPPTSFPTDVTHMTRTIKVSIQLDSGDAPPQGTPVDISIHTN